MSDPSYEVVPAKDASWEHLVAAFRGSRAGIGAVLIAPGPGSQAARTFRPRMARTGLVTQPVREVLLRTRHEGLTSASL